MMFFCFRFCFILSLVIPVPFMLRASEHNEKVRVSVFPVKGSVSSHDLNKAYSLIQNRLEESKRFNILERERIREIISEQVLAMSGLYDFDGKEQLNSSLIGWSDYFIFAKLNDLDITYLGDSVVETIEIKGNFQYRYKMLVRRYHRKLNFSMRMVDPLKNKLTWSKVDLINNQKEEKYILKVKKYKMVKIDDVITYVLIKTEKRLPNLLSIDIEKEKLKENLLTHSINKQVASLLISIAFRGYLLQIVDKNNVLLDIGRNQGVKGKYNIKVFPIKESFIYHPKTGKKVVVQSKDKGTILRIKKIEADTSKAKLVRGKVSDLVYGQKIEVMNKSYFQSELMALNLLLPGMGFFVEKRARGGFFSLGAFLLGSASTIGLAILSSPNNLQRFYANTSIFDDELWASGQGGDQLGSLVNSYILSSILMGVITAVVHTSFSLSAGSPGHDYYPLAIHLDPLNGDMALSWNWQKKF